MHTASDRIAHAEWLDELETAADRLDLGTEARAVATDLFLSDVPDSARSKRAVLGACLYAGSLVAGDGRTQGDVAKSVDVSRLAIQSRWKDQLESAGLQPPTW